MPVAMMVKQIENYPVEDRVMMADAIIASLNGVRPEYEEAWADVAELRLAELRLGKVTIGDVDAVREKVEKRLDANFFRVRLERLTAGERDFLFAMSDCQGTVRLGAVAKALGTSVTTISKRRASLLAKGMIYSPAYGEIAFTVPMFAEFLRRNPRI